LEPRGKAGQGGQSVYQPGWYFVTDDKGVREETQRELSVEDISQILAHGWKLEKAQPSGKIADPTSPSLSPSPINFKAIDFATAAGVVEGIRPTAQKVWNVDIRLAPTQSALPQEVQDAIAKDYGGDADVKGVVHQGFVYLVADQHDSTSDQEATILHEAIGDAAGLLFVRSAKLTTPSRSYKTSVSLFIRCPSTHRLVPVVPAQVHAVRRACRLCTHA
jgi:hypothetical protein